MAATGGDFVSPSLMTSFGAVWICYSDQDFSVFTPPQLVYRLALP